MFGRKGRNAGAEGAEEAAGQGPADTDTEAQVPAATVAGPYDVADVDLENDDTPRADLGGILVPAVEGAELRLQVDEESGEIASVMLMSEEGALEVRAFAAPRGGDLWDEVRPEITADITQRGGTVEDGQGPFGAELRAVVPVQTPDGQPAGQPSRMVAVNGDRWLLRGTYLGRPAMDEEIGELWEQAFRGVIVRRGNGPMPAGVPLPLTLPEDARRVEDPEE